MRFASHPNGVQDTSHFTAQKSPRKTVPARRRAEKIKADYLLTDSKNKLESVSKLCAETGVSLAETVFIGDDVWDVDLLKAVGVAACPADAQDCVKELPDIRVLTKNGGCGCVRELADFILKQGKAHG